MAQFQSDPVWMSRFAGDSDVQGVEQLGEHGVVIRTLLRTVPGAQWDVAREFRRRLRPGSTTKQIEIHSRSASSMSATTPAKRDAGDQL